MTDARTLKRGLPKPAAAPLHCTPAPRICLPETAPVELVGIGASTGGPPALQAILAGLQGSFSAPILIVQHIAPGFLPSLVDWLSQSTGFAVQIAAHGVTAERGQVYFAPDGCHMGVAADGTIRLNRSEPEGGVRPAISYFFRTLAKAYGRKAVGILLSGMGRDGAAELKLMRDRGAITIAQDRESSVVHGMPGEAIALGAATHVAPASQIAARLMAIANGSLAAGGSAS